MGGLQTARYLLGLSAVIFGVLLITLRPDTEQNRDDKQSYQQSEEARPDTTGTQALGNGNVRNTGLEAADQLQHTTQREQVVLNPLGRSNENSYR
eukprot:COSAG02_NODE_5576_length_4219_cov_7.224757_4_plen_95_part_00